MKVLIIGRTGWGNAALRAARAVGAEVLVLAEREESRFPMYAETALTEEARGLQWIEFHELNSLELFKKIKDQEFHVVLATPINDRVPHRIIGLAKRAALRLHPSLLPAYRGPTPTHWAIINGEKETGVTVQHLTVKPDTAPIVGRRAVPILPHDTAGTLMQRQCAAAQELVAEVLRMNTFPAQEQDSSRATLYPGIKERDGFIKFDEPTQRVYDRIRGTLPWPGAYTTWNGRTVRILEARPTEDRGSEVKPGLVIRAEGFVIRVKTKDGAILLKTDPVISRDEISATSVVLGDEIPAFLAQKGKAYQSSIQHTRSEYGIEPGAEEFPLMVVVAVAYPCNARCPHCPYTDGNSEIRQRYADQPYIDPGLFKKIADECGKFGAYVRITGGGEPMMHPADMVSLIEYAKSVGAKVWLNTNGSKMPPDKCDRLLACGTDMIEFSVDAGEESVYRIVRAGLDWDNLLATMKYIIARRNQTGAKTRIVCSMVLQDLIKDKVQPYTEFWLNKIGVDEVIKRKFLTWGSNTTLDPGRSADPDPYLDKTVGDPCPYPFHRLNIDSRGKVEICGFDISGRTNLGSVKEQTIQEIWKGPMFQWWRKMHAERRGGEIPLCRECPDWQYRSWEHNWKKVLRTADRRRAEHGADVVHRMEFGDTQKQAP